MRRVIASKDFLAGILYMTFGLLGLWLGRDLEAGIAESMGAGFFPRLICALLIAIGALQAALSLMRADDNVERGKWRPFVFVTLCVCASALSAWACAHAGAHNRACAACRWQRARHSLAAALRVADHHQCRHFRRRLENRDSAVARRPVR